MKGYDCKICSKKTTDSQQGCIHSIRNKHQMTADTHDAMSNPKPANSINLDQYCVPCDAIFTTRYSYRLHIQRPHTTPIILSPLYKSASQRKPDINDPNAYCSVCKCRLRTRSIFRTHLHSIHQIGASRECEVPPTFKCPICKRRYKSKRSCDDHVEEKHSVISLL